MMTANANGATNDTSRNSDLSAPPAASMLSADRWVWNGRRQAATRVQRFADERNAIKLAGDSADLVAAESHEVNHGLPPVAARH
jgi:hypothetical protein